MGRVTKPFLPPQAEYEKYLAQIWERAWLTNDGPFVKELESTLPDYLGSVPVRLVANGTLAIQLALKSFDIQGEILTTPFSFVATSSAALWEKYSIKYVDIDPKTWNIDPQKIRAAISPNTEAILATHVFGNPCDVDAIEKIAHEHKLKVIYDAAHAFGIEKNGRSIFDYGDVSICSFHATKVYHTIEGGGVFSKHKDVLQKIERLRNFGFFGPNTHVGVGINAKMSEFNAAMGLLNLRYLKSCIQDRLAAIQGYDAWALKQKCTRQHWVADNKNGAYAPFLMPSEETLLAAEQQLLQADISGRRYFYPSLNTLFAGNTQSCPISEQISKRVFCMPILDPESMQTIQAKL